MSLLFIYPGNEIHTGQSSQHYFLYDKQCYLNHQNGKIKVQGTRFYGFIPL